VMDFHAQQTSEAHLETLLEELLHEEEETGAASGRANLDVPPEIAELRDTARLLRSASQWVPLPEGRNAVRRALMATAQQGGIGGDPARTAWRRTGRWLIAGAAVAASIVAAFGLGAGLLDGLGSPKSPLYGLRLEIDAARVALVPSRVGKAELIVQAAHARIAEIDAMVSSGDTRVMELAAAALDGEAAWLHALTAELSPADRQRLEAELGR